MLFCLSEGSAQAERCEVPQRLTTLQAIEDIVAQAAVQVNQAQAKCKELKNTYTSDFACDLKRLPGFYPQTDLADSAENSMGVKPPQPRSTPKEEKSDEGWKRPPPRPPLLGGYILPISSCKKKDPPLKFGILKYSRQRALAATPEYDECSIEDYSPPNFKLHSTRSILANSEDDYKTFKRYTIEKHFDWDPTKGSRLRLVSRSGEVLECYAGPKSFDPENKSNVEYEYCVRDGEKISVPRKDQLRMIETGRFTLKKALSMPPPQEPQTLDIGEIPPTPRPDQIIPVEP